MKRLCNIVVLAMIFALIFATVGAPASTVYAAENTGLSSKQSSSPLMTPNAWDALGSGLNAATYAIAIDGTDIYAGGDFTDAGGDLDADRIAKWNGTSWSALDTGLNGTVRTIVVDGANIYVGGHFTAAGGNANANYIAKWDGESWSALDTGLNGAVRTIVVDGANIYVGGEFTDAGGDTDADYIAKWDGEAWSVLGTGMTGWIYTIAVSGSNIYAGGNFSNAGGNAAADYIVKLDGNSWDPIGATPLNNTVHFAVALGGEIYVAGDFTNVGGTNYFAHWNGASWSAVGGGFSGPTRIITIDGDDTYVGGHFTDAGGDTDADYIAKWDGASWSALSTTPLNGSVNHIVLNGQYVYASGTFLDAGGNTNADRIARFEFDVEAPSVDSFTVPSSTNSLDIPITAFTASDNDTVSGYLITESSTQPSAGSAGWTASAPSTYTVGSGGNYTLFPWAKDAAGNVSAVYGSPASVNVDTAAPTVTAFSAPSSSNSLTIPTTSFTALDNIAVTGYKITESSTPPSAGAAGWTGSAPSDYTVSSDGNYTLYPWAKDAAGNVSAVYGSPASVAVDTTAPTVTSFSAPSSSNSLTISITAFTASDNVAVTGYIITESSTPPSAGAAGWTGSAPSDYTVSGDGNYTLYPWAKDAAGNVSAVYGSPASVDVETGDTTAPTINSFSATSPSNSLNIPITTFTASDDTAVTGYLITDSNTAPSSSDPDWTGSAPSTYTVGNLGNYTLYPWAKDAAGNVSAVYGSPAAVFVCSNAITVTSNADSGAGTLRQAMMDACSGGTITFDANYTITLSSQLPAVTDTMVITGNGAANTIIQANAAANTATYRIFEVDLTGNLTIDGLTVRHGRCAGGCTTIFFNYGGGILNSGTLSVKNSVISDNSANYGGGGMYNSGGALTVTNSTIFNNSADYGGGIMNDGTLSMKNNTFSNNSANFGGGGMYNSGGTITLANSTLSNNSATDGGGIYNDGVSSTLTVTNSTLSDNNVSSGGGIYNLEGTVNYANTIIANSIGGNDCVNNSGTIGININNLVEDGSCSASLNGDPNLGPLANNGGSTQTHALLAGSPAIDAGDDANCPATDQRGVARPQEEHCDIGAYEYQSGTISLPSAAVYDGWILESSETSGVGGKQNKNATLLRVGDDAANKQYRSILSFDTSTLPEGAVITSVTLKFKHAGVSGTNPFNTHGKLLADMCEGPFKANPVLQLADFKAGCPSGSYKVKALIYANTKVDNWYSQSLLPDNFQFINLEGVTQFRLRFAKDDNNDFGADFLKLFSGNALNEADRPQLVIEYYVP